MKFLGRIGLVAGALGVGAFALGLAGGEVGCVPAGEERNPRGALGIVFVPSSAARGEPFVTADGWTVRIESLVVFLYLTASYGWEAWWALFDTEAPFEVVLNGIPAREAGAFVSFGINAQTHVLVGNPDIVKRVTPEQQARFRQPADGKTTEPCEETTDPVFCFFPGPTFHLRARAEKGGRVITLDFALIAPRASSAEVADAIIRRNDIVRIETPVIGEAFFTNPDGALVFEDLAAADVDRDGEISLAELIATKRPFLPDPDGGADEEGGDGEDGEGTASDAGRRAPEEVAADEGDFFDDEEEKARAGTMYATLRGRALRLFPSKGGLRW